MVFESSDFFESRILLKVFFFFRVFLAFLFFRFFVYFCFIYFLGFGLVSFFIVGSLGFRWSGFRCGVLLVEIS